MKLLILIAGFGAVLLICIQLYYAIKNTAPTFETFTKDIVDEKPNNPRKNTTSDDEKTINIYIDSEENGYNELRVSEKIPNTLGINIPEDSVYLQRSKDLHDKVMEQVEQKCHRPLTNKVKEACNYDRAFTMIWDQNDANRRLNPEDYTSDVSFHAYGEDTSTLNEYQAHMNLMNERINDKMVEGNSPIVQDPRCSFLQKNLPETEKYIFYNNSKLLSHPDGPKEPNLCYIPPHVSNVLYHDQLCSSANELIYHDDFSDILEIEDIEVHATVDKDIGTPMCVIRFKDQEESGLSVQEYREKLGEYVQYLYKQDPERQYWKESTQWLFNKNQNDQAIIARHMADKVWLSDRLAVLADIIRQKREQIAMYMRDPNSYINDYVMLTGDEDQNNDNAGGDIEREREVAEHCARHGQTDAGGFGKDYSEQKGVGSHLAHLAFDNNIGTYLDKWTDYDENQKNARTAQKKTYITNNADFASVWSRSSLPPGVEPATERTTKQDKCETIVYKDPEDEFAPWLGFRKVDYENLNGQETNKSFTIRESDPGVAHDYYMDQCMWTDLKKVDNIMDNSDRRSESCTWATDKSGNAYNCDEYGSLFTGEKPVHTYFDRLDSEVRQSLDNENADDKITNFLIAPQEHDGTFRAFADGQKCVYRDKLEYAEDELDGCVTEFDDIRLPQPPGTNTLIFGKGNYKYTDSNGKNQTDVSSSHTNVTWVVDNLIVSDVGGDVTIEGKAESKIEEKLQPVVTLSSDDGDGDPNTSTITLNSGYQVINEPGPRQEAAYVQPVTGQNNFEPIPSADTNYVQVSVTDNSYDMDDHDYTLGNASCVIRNDKMIVDKDNWIHASATPSKIQTGPFVRQGGINTRDPSNPKDSEIMCDLDPNDFTSGRKYQASIQDNSVSLQDFECDAVTGIRGQTTIIDNGTTDTCAIDDEVFQPSKTYSFSGSGAGARFDPINIDPGNIYTYNGGGSFDPFEEAIFTLSPNLEWQNQKAVAAENYAITHDNFNSECGVEGTNTELVGSGRNTECHSSIEQVECPECPEIPEDTGPGGKGLYRYTSSVEKTKQGTGIYSYIDTMNYISKLENGGLKNIDITNHIIDEPTCYQMSNAFTESCEIPLRPNEPYDISSPMSLFLEHTPLTPLGHVTSDIIYDVREGNAVFSVPSGFENGSAYTIDVNEKVATIGGKCTPGGTQEIYETTGNTYTEIERDNKQAVLKNDWSAIPSNSNNYEGKFYTIQPVGGEQATLVENECLECQGITLPELDDENPRCVNPIRFDPAHRYRSHNHDHNSDETMYSKLSDVAGVIAVEGEDENLKILFTFEDHSFNVVGVIVRGDGRENYTTNYPTKIELNVVVDTNDSDRIIWFGETPTGLTSGNEESIIYLDKVVPSKAVRIIVTEFSGKSTLRAGLLIEDFDNSENVIPEYETEKCGFGEVYSLLNEACVTPIPSTDFVLFDPAYRYRSYNHVYGGNDYSEYYTRSKLTDPSAYAGDETSNQNSKLTFDFGDTEIDVRGVILRERSNRTNVMGGKIHTRQYPTVITIKLYGPSDNLIKSEDSRDTHLDTQTESYILLNQPVLCNKVEIIIEDYSTHPSMRAGLFVRKNNDIDLVEMENENCCLNEIYSFKEGGCLEASPENPRKGVIINGVVDETGIKPYLAPPVVNQGLRIWSNYPTATECFEFCRDSPSCQMASYKHTTGSCYYDTFTGNSVSGRDGHGVKLRMSRNHSMWIDASHHLHKHDPEYDFSHPYSGNTIFSPWRVLT